MILQRVLKFLVLLAVLAFSMQAQAAEFGGKKDHKGFFIGFGLGGGMMNLSGEGESETKAAFTGDFRIGGGITEDVLLMYYGAADYSKIDDVNFTVYHSDFAAQWFAWEGFYVRPSIGLAVARASTNVVGVSVAADSKVSLGGSLGTGYEFRFGRYFSLSPELIYRYAHIRDDGVSGNSHVFGAQAGLNWYF